MFPEKASYFKYLQGISQYVILTSMPYEFLLREKARAAIRHLTARIQDLVLGAQWLPLLIIAAALYLLGVGVAGVQWPP
jgi:hypothetical protein